ncbi:MAG: CvpA family protein [Bacteroidota bacterium]
MHFLLLLFLVFCISSANTNQQNGIYVPTRYLSQNGEINIQQEKSKDSIQKSYQEQLRYHLDRDEQYQQKLNDTREKSNNTITRSNKVKLIKKKAFLNPFHNFDSLIGFLLDVILLLILLLATWYGFRNGILVHLVISFLGTSPAYFFRHIIQGGLATMLQKKIPMLAGIANLAALAILVLFYFFFLRAIYRLLCYIFRETALVHIDNVLGAIFWLSLAAIILSVLIILLENWAITLPKKYTDYSFIYHQVLSAKPQVMRLLKKAWVLIQLILRG